MRARILCAAAAIWVLPVATSGQDGLRSASLPERPLTSTLSPARGDLFLAEPNTYTPRKDRRDRPFPFLDHLPVYWYMTDVLPYIYQERVAQHADQPPAESRPRRQEPIPRDRPAPAERPPAAAPGIPKTFYVIAGWYAGDKPPLPAWLPPGCDPSNVRVIPP